MMTFCCHGRVALFPLAGPEAWLIAIELTRRFWIEGFSTLSLLYFISIIGYIARRFDGYGINLRMLSIRREIRD